MSKEQSIITEIVGKVVDYENNMTDFFSAYNEASDNFTLKQPSNKKQGYTNYRTAETHRAVMTLSAFMYRALTANDPFFELKPMDMVGKIDQSLMFKTQYTLETQLKLSGYKQKLWQSCAQAILFGTSCVQEPFYDVRIGNLGRRMPVTGFEPRSLLTTYFDRNATSVNSSDYVITLDMMSEGKIANLAKNDPTGKTYIPSRIKALVDDKNAVTWNEKVRERLNAAGYTETQLSNYREILTYAGKLEAFGDGVEYVAMVGNRKHLIAFYANPLQNGMRPFKVHRYIPWELELLGYGVGLLLGSLQRSIDNNRNKYHDRVAVANMGITLMNKYSSIAPSDLAYLQNHVIATEDIGNSLAPLAVDYNAINAGMKLEEKLTEELRATSGATDTLQAITTDATATEVSLAQNSAMRNASVRAELYAEDVVKPHLEFMHANNTQNMSYPFIISVDDEPTTVYPNDMLTDFDFVVKTTTDKDYAPSRLRRQIEFLQILTSTKSNLPPEFQSKVAPVFERVITDAAKNMGINMAGLKNVPTRMDLPMGVDLANSGVMAGMQAGANGNLEGIQNGISQLEAAV